MHSNFGAQTAYDGAIAGEIVDRIGALMAAAAETYGALVSLGGGDQTRDEAEQTVLQAIYENAGARIEKLRAERQSKS